MHLVFVYVWSKALEPQDRSERSDRCLTAADGSSKYKHTLTETAATIRNKIDIIAVSMNMRRNTSSLPLFKNLLQYLGARNGSCYATFALGERHPAALRFIGRSRKLLGLDWFASRKPGSLMVFMLCFYTFRGWNGRNQQTEISKVVFQPGLLRCKPILITLKVYFVQTKKKL